MVVSATSAASTSAKIDVVPALFYFHIPPPWSPLIENEKKIREQRIEGRCPHCGVLVTPGPKSEIGINDCIYMLSLTSWFAIYQKLNHLTSGF